MSPLSKASFAAFVTSFLIIAILIITIPNIIVYYWLYSSVYKIKIVPSKASKATSNVIRGDFKLLDGLAKPSSPIGGGANIPALKSNTIIPLKKAVGDGGDALQLYPAHQKTASTSIIANPNSECHLLLNRN